MPFDEEESEETSAPSREGLKRVSSQKSIFDSIPKKPTQADLERKIKQMQDRDAGHKLEAAQLAVDFNKVVKDRTLRINKNVIQKDMERELIDRMIAFAFEVNSDVAEQDGAGSVSLILLLLKTLLYQRDRINDLEYSQEQSLKLLDELKKKVEGLDNIKKSG